MRADAPGKNPSARRSLARAVIVALAALAVAVAVAAFGGSSSPGVANLGHHGNGSQSSPSSGSGAENFGSGPGTSSSSSPGSGASSGFSMSIAGASAADELKFSQCMRANGEPNFPDPNGSGVIQGSGIDLSSPQYQRAQSKCQKYLGRQGAPNLSPAKKAQALAQLLKYSECMRSHGVPNFPDPTTSGGGVGLMINGSPSSGLDSSSPIFQRAQSDCSSLPGAPRRLPGGPPPGAGSGAGGK
jgi:opacity protein-like surface antigen